MIPQSVTPTSQTAKGPARAIGRVGIVVVAGILLATAMFILLRPGYKPALPEVDRAELTMIDGRLHRQRELAPFTGIMIERYPDGKVQSRSSISNGLLEGLSEGWYTNGQKQVVEHFHAGVSHGQRIKWHPTGAKLSEANIVQGKIEGVFRRWHENGVLAEEIPMKEGQPDGLSRAYYPNGRLRAEARLNAGRLLEQKFWADDPKPQPAIVESRGIK
jgi:antitoxin component YwqK of YwqJK toxin-antitoxin module